MNDFFTITQTQAKVLLGNDVCSKNYNYNNDEINQSTTWINYKKICFHVTIWIISCWLAFSQSYTHYLSLYIYVYTHSATIYKDTACIYKYSYMFCIVTGKYLHTTVRGKQKYQVKFHVLQYIYIHGIFVNPVNIDLTLAFSVALIFIRRIFHFHIFLK